jgi:hypothetical protein
LHSTAVILSFLDFWSDASILFQNLGSLLEDTKQSCFISINNLLQLYIFASNKLLEITMEVSSSLLITI